MIAKASLFSITCRGAPVWDMAKHHSGRVAQWLWLRDFVSLRLAVKVMHYY